MGLWAILLFSFLLPTENRGGGQRTAVALGRRPGGTAAAKEGGGRERGPRGFYPPLRLGPGRSEEGW